MTQIANVRSFNGTSDEIELNAADFASTTPTAYTIAAIALRDTDSVWRWLWSCEGAGTGGTEFALGQGDTVTGRIANWQTPGGSGGIQSSDSLWTVAMGWCLVAVTKVDGAANPRFHRYRYDTLNWAHEDAGSGQADMGTIDAGAKVWIGTYDGAVEWFDGKIACIGVWRDTALSDGQLEGLTSTITAWEAESPTGLWLLNQTDASQSVVDRIGNGDQVGINGTTVAAESGLAFDDGIGVLTAPTLRVVRSNLRW